MYSTFFKRPSGSDGAHADHASVAQNSGACAAQSSNSQVRPQEYRTYFVPELTLRQNFALLTHGRHGHRHFLMDA